MADDATKLDLVMRFTTCPELFDLKIICNGREFPVHRFVISLHSEVFKRACVSPFTESSKRAIDMSKDYETDDYIRALIEYMYVFDHSEPSDLEEAAHFHVQMAVLADKWDVRGLRELAAKKFTSMLIPHWSVLVPAIKVAYNSAPIIAEMCKAVVKVAAESKDVLLPDPSNAIFDQVMLDHPQFAVDVVHHQAQVSLTHLQAQISERRAIKAAKSHVRMLNCPYCGHAQASTAQILQRCRICNRVF